MNDLSILSIVPVEFRLDLKDPFIVTAHHIDHFPAANAEMRPQTAAKIKSSICTMAMSCPVFGTSTYRF